MIFELFLFMLFVEVVVVSAILNLAVSGLDEWIREQKCEYMDIDAPERFGDRRKFIEVGSVFSRAK